MNPEMFQILVALVGFLAGFLIRALWSEVKELKVDQTNLSILVARDYVKRTDMDGIAGQLFRKLDLVIEKLDNKVSKDDCGMCRGD